MERTSSKIFLQNFEVLFPTLVESAGATWIWCPDQVPMSSGKEMSRGKPNKGPVQQRAAYVRQGWGGQGCSGDSPSSSWVLPPGVTE